MISGEDEGEGEEGEGVGEEEEEEEGEEGEGVRKGPELERSFISTSILPLAKEVLTLSRGEKFRLRLLWLEIQFFCQFEVKRVLSAFLFVAADSKYLSNESF